MSGEDKAVLLPYNRQHSGGCRWYDGEYYSYRRARMAVLRSYDLRGERLGLKEMLKKSVRGINETAERLVWEVREGAIKRRVAIRVLRAKVCFSSWLLRCVRCFASCSGRGEFVH